jgi:lipoprotein-releasing system permease protein
MLPFPLFLALKYLKPQRSFVSVVTLISVAGVMLGVAILVIVLSVMTGFDDMWREKILSFKPHLTVTRYGNVIPDEEGLCRRLQQYPGVRGVAATVETRVLLQHDSTLSRETGEQRIVAPVVIGITPERAASISRVQDHMAFGRFDLEGDSILLGSDLAYALGVRVGDRVLLYSPMNVINRDEMYLPEELSVSGIFDMGMRDFDGDYVFTSIEVARELVGLKHGARSAYLMLNDPFRFEDLAARIQRDLGDEYDVRTWKEIDTVLFSALSNEKTMMFVLLVFITVVAIFCVTNTLIVITVHKTGEIGLLKALGFSSRGIMAAFVWHGWIQCLAGIAAGIGGGLLVLHNLKGIVAALASLRIDVFPKEIYGLSEIPWRTSTVEILQIAGFVMMFCTVASLLPAWRAARLDPVRALRQE